MKMQKKEGFTMLELMAVVAIISILAAAALPLFSSFQRRAELGAFKQSTRGAVMAIAQYGMDNKGFDGLPATLTVESTGAITEIPGAYLDVINHDFSEYEVTYHQGLNGQATQGGIWFECCGIRGCIEWDSATPDGITMLNPKYALLPQ